MAGRAEGDAAGGLCRIRLYGVIGGNESGNVCEDVCGCRFPGQFVQGHWSLLMLNLVYVHGFKHHFLHVEISDVLIGFTKPFREDFVNIL